MRTRTAYREKYRVTFEQPTGKLEIKTIRVPLLDITVERKQHKTAEGVIINLYPNAVVRKVEFV